MLVAAAIIWITGGVDLSLGSVPLSATSAPRMLFQAAIVLLLAQLPARESTGAGLIAAIALVLLAASTGSPVRRVGDGFEYLAMARNLSRADAPSLAAQDFDDLAIETRAHGDPTWEGEPTPWLGGRGGRYDFLHFWIYPLIAAPFVAGARMLGQHPNGGFTFVNMLLLFGLSWMIWRAGAGRVAALVPLTLLWWIDKAHAEIFIVSLTGMGVMLSETAPRLSLLLIGIATAQMPMLAPLLVASAVIALWTYGRRAAGAAVAAGLIAATYPLYYLWRLGTPSPLTGTVVWHLPTASAVLTPILDPNLGIAWFAPVLVSIAALGIVAAVRQRRWLELAVLAAGAGTVLFAAAQTPNVNHGGTPGMSRYGVWLIGVLLPFAIRGDRVAASVRPIAYTTVAGMAVVFAALTLHPRFGDAATGPTPTRLAALIWTRLPALDNPLPEVFAERVGHVDGAAFVPVATDACEKALVIGTGAAVLWPAQCVARAAPPRCMAADALCYANGASFILAPSQPGFTPLVGPHQ